MERALVSAALGLALATGGAAFAQTSDPHAGHGAHGAATSEMLAASVPANNAVLTQAPRSLALRFAHPVMLQTVSVTGPNDAAVRATFRRAQRPTTSYSVALPSLAAGAYHVRWRATGDGHEMTGDLHFTVQ